MQVTQLILVNASDGTTIRALNATDTLNLATQTKPYSIEAKCDVKPGSVVFHYDGITHPENNPSYVAAGNVSGSQTQCIPLVLAVGAHNISATPFSGAGGTGTPGTPKSCTLTVTNQPVTPTIPAAPSNLVAVASPNSIALSWTDNASNEAEFRIQHSTDGTVFTSQAVVGQNSTSYTHGGLAAGSKHFYKVTAENAGGASPPSNTVSATTASVPPPGTDIPPMTGKLITVNPGQSIDTAVDSAMPGDRVLVKPGTYKGPISVSRSGQTGKPVVLMAETVGSVIVDSTGGNRPFITQDGVHDFWLSGFIFRNATDGGSGNSAGAVQINKCDNFTVQDVTVEKCGGVGMAVISGNNVMIRRCVCRDNGRLGFGASGTKNLLVKDCKFYRNNVAGIDNNGSGSKCTRLENAVFDGVEAYENGGSGWWGDRWNLTVTLRNCHFHHNKRTTAHGLNFGSGAFLEISGAQFPGGDSAAPDATPASLGTLTVENSQSHDNDDSGLKCSSCYNVIFRNNILTNDDMELKDGGRLPFKNYNVQFLGNRFVNGKIIADGASLSNMAAHKYNIDNNVYSTQAALAASQSHGWDVHGKVVP